MLSLGTAYACSDTVRDWLSSLFSNGQEKAQVKEDPVSVQALNGITYLDADCRYYVKLPEEKIAEMLQGTVAILGGGAVGLETAAFLAQRLPEGAAEFGIKIIEQKEKMGMDMGAMARPLLNELKKKNVSFLTTTTATLMDGSKLYVKIGEMTLFVSADTVIWAGGGEPVVDTELTMWLMDERMSYAVVGDANEIGDGGTAIKDAYELYTHLYLA